MRFSSALSNFEHGALIARARWNRDVKEGDKEALSFIFLNKANESAQMPEAVINSGEYEDTEVTVLQHPMKKNRANLYSIWLPTVEDMCAKDWYVLDFRKTEWEMICGNFRDFRRTQNNEQPTTPEDVP